MAKNDPTPVTNATVATAPASDKTGVAAPVSENPVQVIPATTTDQVPLAIYMKIREVPQWAWKARELYEPAIGHTMHTLQEWDEIFKDF